MLFKRKAEDEKLLTVEGNGEVQVDNATKKEESLAVYTNLSEEEFIKENRYSWDLVIVFPGKEKAEVEEALEYVTDIQAAGLQVKLFRGEGSEDTRQKIFCKVRAPLDRLQHFADYINRKVRLNQSETKRLMEEGDEEKNIPKVELPEDYSFSRLGPYQFIHAKYDTEVPQSIYAPDENNPLEPYLDHPFRSSLRLQLIMAILGAKKTEGGAEFNTRVLISKKKVDALYPLHNKHGIDVLKAEWLPWKKWPWQQPVNMIRNYFGEQVALYFAFLGHYSTWLLGVAVLGTLVAILTYSIWKEYDSAVSAMFSFFVALWGIFMLEFWKRKQAILALEWGMVNIEEEQTDRPEFQGQKKKSPINGQMEDYFPEKEYQKLLAKSASIIAIVGLMVVVVVGVCFWFRFYAVHVSNTDWGTNYGDTIASIMNAVQIQVLDQLYTRLAIYLNDNENHRTDTQYQDSIIAKLFVFKFVNSYASFVYIAFIKTSLEGPYMDDGELACDPSCIYLLFINLIIIFGGQIAYGNIVEVLVPYLKAKKTEKLMRESGQKELSAPEQEYIREEYDLVHGLLMDYCELALQFGYMTLFVAALPLAPLLGLVNNWIEIRSDAYKLMTQHRRTLANPAEDIGTWQAIFNIMNILSVMSNAALISFVMDNVWDEDVTMTERLWGFVVFQYVLMFLMFCIGLAVPDVPEVVAKQLQRQAFIQDTVIDKIAMEEEDCFQLLRGLPPPVVSDSLGAEADTFEVGKAEGLAEYTDVRSARNSSVSIALSHTDVRMSVAAGAAGQAELEKADEEQDGVAALPKKETAEGGEEEEGPPAPAKMGFTRPAREAEAGEQQEV